MPFWSRDGKWIYFYSDRSGRYEVWKMPARGSSLPGTPIQLTRNGGRSPYGSPDGKLVYYFREGGVWQVPFEGGKETQLIESVRQWANWAVADNGIYYSPRGEPVVRFFDFKTRTLRTVLDLPIAAAVGTVSRDGRTLLSVEWENAGSDLMLVENFR